MAAIRSPESWQRILAGKTAHEMASMIVGDLVGYRSASKYRVEDVDCLRNVINAVIMLKASPAIEACAALVKAYDNGLARGGSIDWSEVDAAHAQARAALGLSKEG